MRTSGWWAWHSWGLTLFKWWNLVLICWTPWAACDAVTIPFAILLAPLPWTTPFVAQLQICALSPSALFPVLFHLPNMREEACWGHYASNKWSVWGLLNNCLCSQMVEHNYCSPIMICKTLTNTTFCNNHFKFNNCFIIPLELAVTKCGVCKCIAPGALSLISE